jgi:type VI secretion system protein ImpM
MTTSSAELLYFGKVPSRGDFVRSAGQPGLIAGLDKWQAQTMDRLAADPRWKLIYDAAPTVQFAILGTGSKMGLAGHWVASQDASGRRFPFITAAAFELDAPRAFAGVAPLALSRLWSRLEQVARVAHAAADLEHAQASLTGSLDVAVNPTLAQGAFADFLDTHTVASLSQMLAAGGSRLDLRQATLALGLLLQPAMAQGAAKLNKVLCLPLVSDLAMRSAVAAYWLTLVLGFFQRHAVELGVFITTVEGRPYLLLGFHGASASSLQAVIDPALLSQQGVFLGESEWVEGEVDADYGLRKLSNYMRDPGLSLSQVLSSYREVFLGE